MVILQKRFIKDIWRDRKSTYVIYIFFVYLYLFTFGVTI